MPENDLIDLNVKHFEQSASEKNNNICQDFTCVTTKDHDILGLFTTSIEPCLDEKAAKCMEYVSYIILHFSTHIF